MSRAGFVSFLQRNRKWLSASTLGVVLVVAIAGCGSTDSSSSYQPISESGVSVQGTNAVRATAPPTLPPRPFVACGNNLANSWNGLIKRFGTSALPGSDPVVLHHMNYGDGSSAGPVSDPAQLWEHTYSSGGTYTVVYTIEDAAGRMAEASCAFTWVQIRERTPQYQPPHAGNTIPYRGNGGGPTLCRDGSISNSSGRGTCSHHGGIAR